MRNPWSAWVARMDTREHPAALAALRIAMGLAALYTVLHDQSVAEMVWLGPEHGGYRDLGDGPWQVQRLGGLTPQTLHLLQGGALVGALMLLLGLLPQVGALLCLQAELALNSINGHAGGSYDELLTNGLWIMVFAQSAATASVWCRLRTGRWRAAEGVTVPAWPRYLMVLQLVMLYASTGTQKLSSHWLPGGDLGALYYILQQPSWGRFSDMTWLAWAFPVTQLMTLSVWLFEVGGAPLLLLALWARGNRTRAGPLPRLLTRLRYRDLFVAFGLSMHVGIHVLMEVGPFSIISVAMYPALLSGAEWRQLAARLRSARAPAAPPSPSAAAARRSG